MLTYLQHKHTKYKVFVLEKYMSAIMEGPLYLMQVKGHMTLLYGICLFFRCFPKLSLVYNITGILLNRKFDALTID